MTKTKQIQPPMNDVEFIRSRFNYDSETGVLTWKENTEYPNWWNTRYADTQPSAKDALGYLRAKISYKDWSGYVSLHRICYLIHHGELPDVVDHVNGDVTDNRIENLRASDVVKNAWNRKANANTSTGLKGVKQSKDRKGDVCGYVAQIGHKGKREYLGFFKSAEDAYEAYRKREVELRVNYAR